MTRFEILRTLVTHASVAVVVVRDGDGGWMRRAMVGCGDGGKEAEMEVKMRNRS